MGSFSGTCEIVEAKDELNSDQRCRGISELKSGFGVGDKDHKLPVLKLKGKESFEDDINEIFEAISLKNSSKGSFSSQEGTSPLRKNALKKQITTGTPNSPRVGNSEPVSLKQALRDLCISKASEMAAMKRLSKSSVPSRISEAERIKSLYETVVVESKSAGSSKDVSNSEMLSQDHQVSDIKSSNRSVQPSPHCAVTIQNGKETMLSSNDVVSGSKHQQVPMIKTSNQSASSSPQNVPAITENITGTAQKKKEIVSMSKNVVPQTLKMELEQEDMYSPPSSPACSDTDEERPEVHNKVPASTKFANKAPAPKFGRKGKLQTSLSSSSVSGNRIGKLTRSTPGLAKSVLRNRTFVNKKIQESTSAACKNIGNNDLNPSASELVCQRCRCNLKDTSEEKDEDTRTSNCAEVSSRNVNSGAIKLEFNSSSCSDDGTATTVTPEMKKSKSREKGEFSHSSKSSDGGEHSSGSTSISGESNLSGSGYGNRPHMSKDVRWEAIRHIRMQHGVLDLNHFNLLKKLGCGDIGSVYLAELIGTNCLFAVKVMDTEFLTKRKKMGRAQTEREIIGMLDHPFLPTLYAQFTTDSLSCLVMEFCPGGDLHVLRQKQPGRNYSEQAARFYVAEVLLALEYLHMLGVVYRDLKPENILVREDGHIMLTDFDLSLRCSVNPTLIKSSSFNTDPPKISGPCASTNCIQPFCTEAPCQAQCFTPRFLPASAKAKARKLKADLDAQRRSLPQLVVEPTDARSNSFVGTHEYLAPEIIKGGGHGAAVDWWTFGIFLYELLYGRTPFKGCGNEETLANVVLNGLRFPEGPIVSPHARDLIRKLLVKDPENRLGAERGAAEIKQHQFFEGLNWALIRCAVPPDLPHIGPPHPHDTVSDDGESKYLECKATGEHLEFELF